MKKTLFFLIIGIFILFLLNVQLTEAASGDVVITYDDELTGGLTGATVTINCNGSDATCADGNADCDNDGSDNGSITLNAASSTLAVTAACETNEETITKLEVAKDGYVTTVNITDSEYNTGAQNDEAAVLDFGYKITLQDEKTTPAAIASAAVIAGENNTACTYDTNYYYCPVPLLDDDTDADVDAALAGYVTKNWSDVLGGGRDSGTDAQGTYTATDMQFSQTIVITTEAVAAALTGAAVEAGSGSTSCTEDDTAGTYWCAVPYDEDATPNDVSIILNGYVTHAAGDTGDRANDAAAQETVTVNDVQYGYKITSITTQVFSTDIIALVTTLTVGDDTAKNTCASSSSVWYCPVVLNNSNGTMVGNVTLDGYVQADYSLVTGTTRTANADPQRSDTVTGVEYAVKITVLTGATVTTGDSYGTTCTESGSTGIYYCIVPLADTETNIQVVKTGYDTKTESNAWLDRTSNTDAQATYSLSLVAVTVPYPSGSRRVVKKEPITIEGLKTKIAEISAEIVRLKAQLQQLSGGEILEVSLEIPADYRFTVNLEYGQYSVDVKYLQIFLNTDPITQVSQSGAGSPGNETMYFGSLTKAAVICFQEKYRDDILTPWEITEGTGFVGRTTRVKLNELLGG